MPVRGGRALSARGPGGAHRWSPDSERPPVAVSARPATVAVRRRVVVGAATNHPGSSRPPPRPLVGTAQAAAHKAAQFSAGGPNTPRSSTPNAKANIIFGGNAAASSPQHPANAQLPAHVLEACGLVEEEDQLTGAVRLRALNTANPRRSVLEQRRISERLTKGRKENNTPTPTRHSAAFRNAEPNAAAGPSGLTHLAAPIVSPPNSTTSPKAGTGGYPAHGGMDRRAEGGGRTQPGSGRVLEQQGLCRKLNESASWLSDVGAASESGSDEAERGDEVGELLEAQQPLITPDGRPIFCLHEMINESATFLPDADVGLSGGEESEGEDGGERDAGPYGGHASSPGLPQRAYSF